MGEKRQRGKEKQWREVKKEKSIYLVALVILIITNK